MQNFLITLCRLWNVEIITQRLHIVSCCIVTNIILIDVLQYWGRGLGPSPEKIEYSTWNSAFWHFTFLMGFGVELTARSRCRARGSGAKLKALKQYWTPKGRPKTCQNANRVWILCCYDPLESELRPKVHGAPTSLLGGLCPPYSATDEWGGANWNSGGSWRISPEFICPPTFHSLFHPCYTRC